MHVIAVAFHLRHASKIMQMIREDHDDKLEESELAFKGLDNAEQHIQSVISVPFSPLVTKWQFSGQLVFKTTQRLALKALICLAAVVGMTVVVSFKLK